jgi:hypothetical protein
MKAPRLPDNEIEIFHQCVEAIRDGQTTIEACVAKHPHIQDLERSLRAALSLQRVVPSEMPRENKQQLEQALKAKVAAYYPAFAKPTRQPIRRTFFPVTLVAACIVILFGYLLWSQNHRQRMFSTTPDLATTDFSTQLATLSPTRAMIVNATPTKVPTLEDLKAMTQSCLINKRFYNSFQPKLVKGQLNAFINEVKAQTDKKLYTTCANQLIETATFLMTH